MFQLRATVVHGGSCRRNPSERSLSISVSVCVTVACRLESPFESLHRWEYLDTVGVPVVHQILLPEVGFPAKTAGGCFAYHVSSSRAEQQPVSLARGLHAFKESVAC